MPTVAVSEESGQRIGQYHHMARWPDATVDRARELREEGLSLEAICFVLGVPKRTVRDWVAYRKRAQSYTVWRVVGIK